MLTLHRGLQNHIVSLTASRPLRARPHMIDQIKL